MLVHINMPCVSLGISSVKGCCGCSVGPLQNTAPCHSSPVSQVLLTDQVIHPGEAAKEVGCMVLSSKQKYSHGGHEESKGSAEKCRESEL